MNTTRFLLFITTAILSVNSFALSNEQIFASMHSNTSFSDPSSSTNNDIQYTDTSDDVDSIDSAVSQRPMAKKVSFSAKRELINSNSSYIAKCTTNKEKEYIKKFYSYNPNYDNAYKSSKIKNFIKSFNNDRKEYINKVINKNLYLPNLEKRYKEEFKIMQLFDSLKSCDISKDNDKAKKAQGMCKDFLDSCLN